MKTVVSTFLAFFFTVALFAQNFVADEFIVEYVAGTTNAQQQAVRDLFGITNTTDIGDGIELWEEIQFPITVTESGETTIINDVEELLYYINIQEGNEEGTETSAIINNGDPNYIITLFDDEVIYGNGTFDPLPFCDNDENDRLIGPYIEQGIGQSPVKVIIVDQEITNAEVEIIGYISSDATDPSIPPTGTHGNKVYSIIENQLEQAGVNNVSYYNLVIFDNDGTATYKRLLEAFNYISVTGYNAGFTTDLNNCIMNFSANMVIIGESSSLIIWDLWEDFLINHNAFLTTSAGNQGLSTDNIFPAVNNWSNEISVAGTQACFTEPWESSNSNPSSFDIAAEAENVLVHDGNNYRLVNGTSFSSAFVTGAAAQLAARCEEFDPIAIKNQLLNYADENPALTGLVNQGRMLNVSNAIANMEPCGNIAPPPPPPPTPDPRGGGFGGGFGGGGISPLQGNPSPLTLTTTPNPFTTTSLVTIQLPEADDVTIRMYNMVGQLVHQEVISNQQEMTELEWPTPRKLARGTYLLRVQAGEAVEQTMVVKQ